MCWSCNPFCGGCKPPKPRPIKCENCGTFNFDETETCRKCRQPLPERKKTEPVMCLYIGEMCADSCQRHKIERLETDEQDPYCKWHTPVK